VAADGTPPPEDCPAPGTPDSPACGSADAIAAAGCAAEGGAEWSGEAAAAVWVLPADAAGGAPAPAPAPAPGLSPPPGPAPCRLRALLCTEKSWAPPSEYPRQVFPRDSIWLIWFMAGPAAACIAEDGTPAACATLPMALPMPLAAPAPACEACS